MLWKNNVILSERQRVEGSMNQIDQTRYNNALFPKLCFKFSIFNFQLSIP